MASGNKAGKQSNSKRTQSKKDAAANAPRQSIMTDDMKNDIIGVLLAALGVALLVAMVAPGEGALTNFITNLLLLGFGVGAYVLPIALIALGVSFFIKSEDSPILRSSVGIFVIVIAAIGLISLFTTGAENDPNLLFEHTSLKAYGGYLGAGIAWLLLKFTGRNVGIIILVGLMLVGIIICGFSVSRQANRVKDRINTSRDERDLRKQERELRRADRERELQERARQERLMLEAGEEADSTPRISRRPSKHDLTAGSALRSYPVVSGYELPSSSVLDESQGFSGARTRVLRSKAPKLTAAQDEDKDSIFDLNDIEVPADQVDDTEPEVPDFLDRFRRKRDSKESAEGDASAAPTVLLDRGGKSGKTSGKSGSKGKQAPSQLTANPATPPKPVDPEAQEKPFELPPLSILSVTPEEDASTKRGEQRECEETAAALQRTLQEYNVEGKVVGWQYGPTVTLYKVEMPAGVHLSKITSLQNEIALHLAARSVRIYAPIPGTSLVGIEVTNKTRASVMLGDAMPGMEGGPLNMAIGKNIEGEMIYADLAKMPHLLIGGTTGSGKTAGVEAMICSILMRTTPEEVRMIIVDPKRVDFSVFRDMPHLYVPVVTDAKEAAAVLAWAVIEMERRLKVLEKAGANEIKVYNKLVRDGRLEEDEIMPYMVIVIDELSDLMMVAKNEVEGSIVRISQLARAVGIHLIIATQRPASNVVTGMIKANIVTRIAFKVATGTDSRIIFDQTGAEKLVGKGDLLFLSGDTERPQRIQSCFIPPEEIKALVEYLKTQGETDYHNDVLKTVVGGGGGGSASGGAGGGEPDDPLLWDAAEIVVNSGFGSTSNLQRRLKVGYARAGRIMDQLEEHGIVGPADGSKAREVLVSDVLELESLKALEDYDGMGDY